MSNPISPRLFSEEPGSPDFPYLGPYASEIEIDSWRSMLSAAQRTEGIRDACLRDDSAEFSEPSTTWQNFDTPDWMGSEENDLPRTFELEKDANSPSSDADKAPSSFNVQEKEPCFKEASNQSRKRKRKNVNHQKQSYWAEKEEREFARARNLAQEKRAAKEALDVQIVRHRELAHEALNQLSAKDPIDADIHWVEVSSADPISPSTPDHSAPVASQEESALPLSPTKSSHPMPLLSKFSPNFLPPDTSNLRQRGLDNIAPCALPQGLVQNLSPPNFLNPDSEPQETRSRSPHIIERESALPQLRPAHQPQPLPPTASDASLQHQLPFPLVQPSRPQAPPPQPYEVHPIRFQTLADEIYPQIVERLRMEALPKRAERPWSGKDDLTPGWLNRVIPRPGQFQWNGSIYQGSKDQFGRPFGLCKKICPNGDTFVGRFEKGIPINIGRGGVTLPNGTFYIGLLNPDLTPHKRREFA